MSWPGACDGGPSSYDDYNDGRAQSMRAPDILTTSFHLARSARANAANASGESGAGSAPTAVSEETTMGISRMRFTSAASLSTIGLGVPAGANRPCHAVASYPGRVSPMVGHRGVGAQRRRVATA